GVDKSMTKNSEHRKFLDNIFNAFTIIGRGNYVAVYDVKGGITRFSPAAVELFGLPDEYIAGHDAWKTYIHPEDKFQYTRTMNALLEGKTRGYDLTYRTRLKDGSYAVVRHIGATIFDEDGKPAIIGGTMINEGVTAVTDPVTLLRNQYGFFRDLVAATELKRNCVVVLCGINRMNNINEEHGYAFGNSVLQQTAWLLQEVIGQEGTVYRMEGAKFAFLTESLSPEEVAVKYEKIRRATLAGLPVENVRQVLTINGGMIHFGGGTYDERTIHAALNFVYNESKFYHNGKLVNYNGAIGMNTHESLELIAEVRDDILMDCKNFSLRYQPVFNAATEKLTSIEALLCWHSERFGDVPPSAYVPVLERDFLFEELGYWILRRAMEDGLKLLQRKPDLMLNVNISPAQIVDDFLFEEIDKISNFVGFPPKNLCFELTQSCRLIEPEILRRIVRALKRKGILCLIDDFGSGVASIDFLRDLAPNFIKLERDYITHINDPGNLQIVKHLSELASELGTKVCIKGVEDAAIREKIKTFPVTNVQGNFYSEAISLDEIAEKYL
ncbi:MAG: EAL domain-containing protein, partial [Selenomonadaceae bacterium]|nr:EAL domain-containing protein [Selenomonadaceae bacterium]